MTAPLLKPNFTSKVDFSSEMGTAGDPRTLVPNGQYEAQATGFKIVSFRGGIEKIYLRLQIISVGEHFEKEIWAIYTKYDQYRPRSYFYKAWVIAAGRVPQRKEKLSPNDVCGHVFLIKTRTVTTDEDGNPHPIEMHYSVAYILSLIQKNHSSLNSSNPLPKTNYRLPTLPSVNNRKRRGMHG